MQSIGRALMYRGTLDRRFESRNEYVGAEIAPRQSGQADPLVDSGHERLSLMGAVLMIWLAQQLGFGVVIAALIYFFWQFALHRAGPVRTEEARL